MWRNYNALVSLGGVVLPWAPTLDGSRLENHSTSGLIYPILTQPHISSYLHAFLMIIIIIIHFPTFFPRSFPLSQALQGRTFPVQRLDLHAGGLLHEPQSLSTVGPQPRRFQHLNSGRVRDICSSTSWTVDGWGCAIQYTVDDHHILWSPRGLQQKPSSRTDGTWRFTPSEILKSCRCLLEVRVVTDSPSLRVSWPTLISTMPIPVLPGICHLATWGWSYLELYMEIS